MSYRLLTTGALPVTLADAKAHLRVTDSDRDAEITRLIAMATSMAEQETGRSIATNTWKLVLDKFPAAEIQLHWPPIVSIDEVAYLDEDGVAQTLSPSAWVLDDESQPSWLLPAVDTEWPDTDDSANAVSITYTAGYGANCPAPIVSWILLQIGWLFSNRESVIQGQPAMMLPMVDRLLDRYKIWSLG